MQITNPVPGSIIKGIVTVKVDAPGVSKVSFYVDGALKGRDLVAPFTFNWYTTNYPDGFHTIKVVSGNGRDSDTKTFKIQNAPPVPPLLTESPDGTVVQGTNGTIVDSDGRVWTIGTDAKIYVNGIVDAPTSNVVELAYVSHVVYQLNTSGNWYWKAHSTSIWSGPTTISPLAPGLRNCSITLGGKMVEKQTLTAGISCQ